ncbi:endonuclease/exonuclease/phosphatase family protein [Streptomyces sp. APSN-46.1]|uniref:endonuclease/exonuclease/phosphatase family protein n=1 Tax=Streptomyces sp. APSN-46.1 TaxID=2929049 RepID=UPI001FB2CE56|nr:endonuclease/exonuclease/phosphatase family protein [Streptomyces sp. APSN-46.1]MCJ1679086.1 endonuclease/exonuclease/phosphatase family protein [Streptomyces sp. APSN-46.1]
MIRDGGRGRVTAAVAVGLAAVMLLHAWIPNRPGNLGSLAQTLLPWTGAAVPVLLAAALVRPSRIALTAVLLPALAWAAVFDPTLVGDHRAPTGAAADLTAVTHNADDVNPDPAGTARALAASGAELIALQEIVEPAVATYERVLAERYPYHYVHGTVGLWSRHPLSDTRPLSVMPLPRALRATALTPNGPVTVYVAHLPSVRVRASGFTADRRNAAALRLAEEVRVGPPGRTLLLGDLNSTTRDDAVSPLLSGNGLRSAQEAAGAGFGFSWPAAFPVARIDQILVRGLTPVSAWTLPPTASDHLPVAASLRF